MQSRLTVALMSHVRRAGHCVRLMTELRRQAAGAGVRVLEPFVDDGSLGCWGNARQAWLAAAAEGADCAMVLQDDIWFCSDFLAAAFAIAGDRGLADPVSFFMPRKSVVEAAARGIPWVRLRAFMWGQANMLPTYLVTQMVEWLDSMEGSPLALDPKNPWSFHDDVRMAAYFKHRKIAAWATAPSLVEHVSKSTGGSLLGHPGTRTKIYIGDNGNATAIDWSRKDYLQDG